MTESTTRQDNQPAYVLHTYPYRETSLVVEVFSEHFGRVAMIAKGARRPRSAVRGVLMAFQPLQVSWFGKSELRTLRTAEWQGGQLPLKGLALLCGFYLNELLIRFLARDDPHPELFNYYQHALQSLGRQDNEAITLRKFERHMLQELGYALTLEQEVESGSPIVPSSTYFFEPDKGPVLKSARENSVQLLGKTLLDMARDDYSDPVTVQQSKQLMRTLINHYLDNQQLHTRQILKDLQQL